MDKRAATRVPVQIRAHCRRDGILIDGLVEDVSRSGLFLRTSSAIGEGEQAVLDIDLPGQATLRRVVEVARVVLGVGMGLRFVGRPAPSRSLANLIMRQHQALR